MKKTGIFYGTTTCVTEHAANAIARQLNIAAEDIRNVSDAKPSDVVPYGLIVLGASTWGDGDIQDDMHDFIDGLAPLDLKGKEIALFGCGDETMNDTFCNAVGEMHEMLKDTGASFVGAFNADGYTFRHSKASQSDGQMVGLVLDEVNHPDMSVNRILEWCKLLASNN